MEAAQTWFRMETPAIDPATTRAWMRLIKAFALSFVLHFLLLVALPVNPTGGVPQSISTLTARLEPAQAEPESAPVTVDPVATREVTPAPPPEKPATTAAVKPDTSNEPPRSKDAA